MSTEFVSSEIRTEMTVLGSMLLDVVATQDATAVLRADDFLLDSHRKIYRSILGVWQDGENVDLVTVMAELTRKKQIDSVGGLPYLADLVDGIPRNPSVDSYVRLIKKQSMSRAASMVFLGANDRIQDGSEDPRLVVVDAQKKLENVLAEVKEEVSLEQQGMQELERIRRERSGEVKSFVTSGLEEIDSTHGGFAIGELTVIGARPAVGKSTLLRGAVRANCKMGNFSHLISPEMSAGQILRLFASWEASVPFRRARHADRLDDEALANIEAAMRDVIQWPLKIEDRSPITAGEAISSFRATKRKHGTTLAGLDYLQKMKYEGKVEHRHVHVTDALVALASFAKVDRVAMVAISSLTEPGGKDAGRAPTMQDFRQSGDIRYEANTAILLHREIDAETRRPVPQCQIIFDKARSDEAGIKTVFFNPDYICFESKEQYDLRFKP